MIQNVLRDIGGIGIYGVISVCLFFVFFTGMLVWAACLKRGYIVSARNLPLDEPDSRCREQVERRAANPIEQSNESKEP